MPPRRRSETPEAVDALVGVAPLTSRWMERLLARHDPSLTLAQYLALRAIADGSPGAGELAKRTGVSGPAVSQLLSGLVDRDLIERAAAEGDRRRQQLTLSRSGKRALDSANRLLRKQLGTLLEDLPRPEADALARALPRVEALLSGTAPPRRPPPPRHGRQPRPPR
jgi:DNA-binding MarR family transcriptional regulator